MNLFMTKKIYIARDGNELGGWPYDVVLGLFRYASLLPTDHFWTEGMDEWELLTAIIPPPLSGEEEYLRGRDDEEDEWAFYSRDGSTVVGPRSVVEIGSMVDGTFLTEEAQIFLPSAGQWMTIGELARFDPSPGEADARTETPEPALP